MSRGCPAEPFRPVESYVLHDCNTLPENTYIIHDRERKSPLVIECLTPSSAVKRETGHTILWGDTHDTTDRLVRNSLMKGTWKHLSHKRNRLPHSVPGIGMLLVEPVI
jgi:hypothetical protein